MSTGTKCVSGEHMSVTGAVLNDSHAEIVSRRCLMKYLYAQLELQCSQSKLKSALAASLQTLLVVVDEEQKYLHTDVETK